MLSVIIPASNEEAYIGECLAALFASAPVPGGAEAIVVANGCRDQTVAVARSFVDEARQAGWDFEVLDLARGSKPGALNAGDATARGDMRAYLDADVVVSSPLMAQLVTALLSSEPLYASGRAEIPPAKSWITRAYAKFWQLLPFARSTAPGYGLFAVNAPGRARWGDFPAIISDDTFVRLQFRPAERVQVAGSYRWPMIEGFQSLVKVRRRQDAGVAEIAQLWPELPEREGKDPLTWRDLIALALRAPLGFVVYAAVSMAVRLQRPRNGAGWTRGR